MRTIKRYSNRKLYDTETRQYVTLNDLGEMLHHGIELIVLDNETGEDITNATLAKVLVRHEAQKTETFGLGSIKGLVAKGSDSIVGYLQQRIKEGADIASSIEGEIRKQIRKIIEKGEMTEDDAGAFLRVVQKRLNSTRSDVETALDGQYKSLLGKLNLASKEDIKSISSTLEQVKVELQSLRERIEKLEKSRN